jgi:hypothetical protein
MGGPWSDVTTRGTFAQEAIYFARHAANAVLNCFTFTFMPVFWHWGAIWVFRAVAMGSTCKYKCDNIVTG